MRETELQGRGRQLHILTLANGFDLAHPLDDISRRSPVVEMRIRNARSGGEDPRVIRTAHDDRTPARSAALEKRIRWALLEQRVAPSEQETIDLCICEHLLADANLVHANADRAHDAGLTQLMHGAKPVHRLREHLFV